MSSWDIDFDRLAFREYVRAAQWYRTQSARAADRFIVAVDEAIEKIRANPLQGAIFRKRFRWVRARKFPYIVYYEVIPDRVIVMAVAHSKRRPGYWMRRANKP